MDIQFKESGLYFPCSFYRSSIDEAFIWQIFMHIFLALKECHRHREGDFARPILHRDIKPGNIFLDAQVAFEMRIYIYTRDM